MEYRSGTVSYVAAATTVAAGIAEELGPVPRGAAVFECGQMVLLMPHRAFESIAPIAPDCWPTLFSLGLRGGKLAARCQR